MRAPEYVSGTTRALPGHTLPSPTLLPANCLAEVARTCDDVDEARQDEVITVRRGKCRRIRRSSYNPEYRARGHARVARGIGGDDGVPCQPIHSVVLGTVSVFVSSAPMTHLLVPASRILHEPHWYKS